MNDIFIARSNAVAARSLDGEMMIMSARDSTLFTLNPVGTLIWQSADGRTSLAEITRRKVCLAFEVDPDEAFADAASFVSDLAAHGILIVSSEPIEANGSQNGEQV